MIEASPAKLLFQSFRDRDLESRDASQQDCRNAKHVLAQPVVTAIGHIDGRWRKELVQPSSFSEFRGSVREA
jgi:hypothetical protein